MLDVGPICLSHYVVADMLEVGCFSTPFSGDKGLTVAETRSHFGSWAIVSSPLTLSHDVNNDTVQDAVWPLISNKEVLAVNQVCVHPAACVPMVLSFSSTWPTVCLRPDFPFVTGLIL